MFGIETIFDSIPQFILVCLILAAAEAVYVLLGFGAGLISVGTMAGNSIHLRIEESTFRRLVSAALLVIGLLPLIPAGR
jgi:putative Ca2+/H+ antiporter (TMEM165/GDT1 family)